MAKALGRIIQDLREEADLSRSALARVARMTEGEVWRVENEARTNVRFITVFRLASALEERVYVRATVWRPNPTS